MEPSRAKRPPLCKRFRRRKLTSWPPQRREPAQRSRAVEGEADTRRVLCRGVFNTRRGGRSVEG
ncbi:hypothetical protein BT93_C2266 [Corymbia citriodora subsp. variegata]|nr:hypothetical protein BT93_C2266 [Corymbia citriodora subsp. variegata]